MGDRRHRTCSIIGGKIVPKVKFDRGCRTDRVLDVREDVREDVRRMNAG